MALGVAEAGMGVADAVGVGEEAGAVQAASASPIKIKKENLPRGLPRGRLWSCLKRGSYWVSATNCAAVAFNWSRMAMTSSLVSTSTIAK